MTPCLPSRQSLGTKRRYSTYAWELDAAVTAFGGRTLLFDVKISKLAAGGLDHADLVRFGVVSTRGTIVSI
jgi:hypothetical protein